MPTPLQKRLRLLASVVSVLVLLVAAAGGWFYLQLRASLPQLDGRAQVAGLGAPVTITRDALGVPTVHGASATDVARALGWLHGQERFFQMDLLRRRSAGELAELVGAAALPLDKATRVHGFRHLAEQVVARSTPEERAVIDAYVAGVNAGREALRQKPFEYLVLRTAPQPWRPEDSALVAYSMWLDLQESDGRHERSLATLRDTLGSAAMEFFAPLASPNDAALDGSIAPLAPMPTAKEIDLRKRPKVSVRERAPAPVVDFFPAHEREFFPGSNAFALAGARTASGVALLANDMHLDHAVPNIWFRAALEWSDTNGAHRVVGVTLPGAPSVIVGSNGHVAWGFTDAYADTSDVVIVQRNSLASSLYRRGEENLEFENRREVIRVKGGAPVEITVPWTVWGPVIGDDERGHALALHWLAHDPAATNFEIVRMAAARDVDEALAIVHHSGMPTNNCIVAGADGTIAWTIAGRLPRRVGFDGRSPVSWMFGDRRWEGFLPPAEVPVVKQPASGQLWSANQRAVGSAAGALIGDGGAAAAPRAAQIRDDLTPLTHATPRDLLGVQLDDRALHLAPWHKLLLDTLTPDAVAQNKTRATLRALVEKWEGRASVDSVSYRLVRAFRLKVIDFALTPIFAPCAESYERFNWNDFHYEPALWAMLREKPPHLLDPRYASWDALLVAAADAVVADLDKQGVPLASATWGRRNTARIVHPFARTLPAWLTGWLNMPADQLPGDANMPRVDGPSHGASERLVVSPGREAEGIFHMPGGQSGHPLSPFYRAGHEAWVRGEPTPLLPGETKYTLTLAP